MNNLSTKINRNLTFVEIIIGHCLEARRPHFFTKTDEETDTSDVERDYKSDSSKSVELLSNERGSLVLAMILCIAISIGTIFLLTQRNDDSTYYRRVMLWRGAARVQVETVQTAIESPVALVKTMNAAENNPTSGGASLSRCLHDPTYDCPAGPHDLTIYNEDNSLLTDPATPSLAVDMNGRRCDQFGDFGCLLRIKVTWSPVCPATGICNSHRLSIKSTFETQGLNDNLSNTVNVATKDLDISLTLYP